MEKDKVYISGAIAHYNIDERKGAFLDAENRLRAMGRIYACCWIVSISIC